MPRRIRQRPSLLTPAGSFIRRLSDADTRMRRRLFILAIIVIICFSAYSVVSGEYGVPRIVKLNLQKKTLEDNNRLRLAELIDANRERDMLKFDYSYIEFIARTKYHMAAPDETIYRYRGR